MLLLLYNALLLCIINYIIFIQSFIYNEYLCIYLNIYIYIYIYIYCFILYIFLVYIFKKKRKKNT